METDGGGWTVVQHHGISNNTHWDLYDNLDTKLQANWGQTWKGYKEGFGHIQCNGEADFWVGNDYLNMLTNPKNMRGLQSARIDLVDWNMEERWGYYNVFMVQPERAQYKMIAKAYSEEAGFGIGDAWGQGIAFEGREEHKKFTRQNGMKFTTKDRDNDNFCKQTGTQSFMGKKIPIFGEHDKAAGCEKALNSDDWKNDLKELGNCATEDKGGFWYNRCSAGTTNGKIYKGGWFSLPTLPVTGAEYSDAMTWGTYKPIDYSLMMAEIRIRPKNFATMKSNRGRSFDRTMRGGVPMPEE